MLRIALSRSGQAQNAFHRGQMGLGCKALQQETFDRHHTSRKSSCGECYRAASGLSIPLIVGGYRIHADRITRFASASGLSATPATPSNSSFSRSPMLMSPCRAAWA